MNKGFKETSLNKLIVEKRLKKNIIFVLKSLEAMKNDLIESKETLPNHEEKIRNYLKEKYLQNSEFRNLNSFNEMVRFEIESPENYDEKSYLYVGRIDLKILGEESLVKDEAYNVIECKRIDGKNTLNKEYIENGLKRFVTKKYSSYNNQNAMLGFVVRNIDIFENTEKINELQQVDKEINVIEFEKIEKDYYLYRGRYNNGKLTILHAFSNISGVIDKK